jgi:hypothetical protein
MHICQRQTHPPFSVLTKQLVSKAQIEKVLNVDDYCFLSIFRKSVYRGRPQKMTIFVPFQTVHCLIHVGPFNSTQN